MEIKNTMEVCRDFRGLLLADHVDALKQMLKSEYIDKMHESTKQFKNEPETNQQSNSKFVVESFPVSPVQDKEIKLNQDFDI